MWSPTHVQVTIQRARNLLIKGKNGTNNPFVTIAIGKEKYQTSIKEKENSDVIVWHEQCELLIPKIGNTACIVLTALHRNQLGIDEFLGTVSIPLSSFDVYERPRSRWYKLEGKPGKEKGKDKERGELEVRIAFTVKASAGSLTDLSKKEKHKSSLGHLSNVVGGSLLSLGSSERKLGIKQIAKSISKKVSKKKRDSNGGDGASENGSRESISNSPFSSSKSSFNNIDPGVISEDEDEFTFDNLSHKSSGSSLNVNPALENLAGGEFLRRSTKGPPAKPPRILPASEKPLDEWEQKLYGKSDSLKRYTPEKVKTPPANMPEPPESPTVVISAPQDEKPSTPDKFETIDLKKSPELKVSAPSTPSLDKTVTPSPKPVERKLLPSPQLSKQDSTESEPKEMSKFAKKLQKFQPYKKQDKKDNYDRFIVGEEAMAKPEMSSKHSKEILEQFKNKSRDDLIDMVIDLQKSLDKSNHQLKELEDYLDQLLLRVMETTPKILQNPYINCKTQASFEYR